MSTSMPLSASPTKVGEQLRRKIIYLDHNATTPPDPELLVRVSEWVGQDWGNPSSIHQFGRGPKARLREARSNLANALNCSALEIVFTSCGSESNSNALILLAEQARRQRSRAAIVASRLEHPSILKTLAHLEALGHPIRWAKVLRSGLIDVDHFSELLQAPDVGVATLMLANNETGVIQPVEKLAHQARASGVLFHTDAVQALGRIPVDLIQLGVDSASFAGHKFYALKGAGVLFLRKGSPIRPLIFGGGQERSRRGGTENTLAIASLGFMAGRLNEELKPRSIAMKDLRDRFEATVQSALDGIQVNGAGLDRLPSTSSLLIEGIDGETLLMALDIEGFAVSTGAACSAGSPEPSHVLLAMGLSRAEAQQSLRVGLGWGTTQAEIDLFVEALARTVARLRAIRKQSRIEVLEETI